MPEEQPSAPFALPPKQERIVKASYTFPAILLGFEIRDGFKVAQVREGKTVQVEIRSEDTFWDAPLDQEPIFIVKALNHINFGGTNRENRIDVINDMIAVEGVTYGQTTPSTSEYLAMIGKEVKIAFSCRPDRTQGGRMLYRINRQYLVLQ